MARESFQRELDRLVEEVLELGRDVENSLQTMVEAIENWDAEMAGQEIGSDVGYKERGDDIEEECLILQARQAPVAQDLRLIRTVQAVTNHLVRTGALCEHICRGIVQTAEAEGDPELEVALLRWLDVPAKSSVGVSTSSSTATHSTHATLKIMTIW